VRWADPRGLELPEGLFPEVDAYNYSFSDTSDSSDECPTKCDKEWFDCFANCVEKERWDWGWITAATIGNPVANALAGETGRTGVGGVPSHATSWQHKAGALISRATGNPWFSRVGRFVGRAALIPTVFEGFYDIGAIGRCAAVCNADKCSY
jgi:hypothetical protein